MLLMGFPFEGLQNRPGRIARAHDGFFERLVSPVLLERLLKAQMSGRETRQFPAAPRDGAPVLASAAPVRASA
jgi:hypothetical protein